MDRGASSEQGWIRGVLAPLTDLYALWRDRRDNPVVWLCDPRRGARLSVIRLYCWGIVALILLFQSLPFLNAAYQHRTYAPFLLGAGRKYLSDYLIHSMLGLYAIINAMIIYAGLYGITIVIKNRFHDELLEQMRLTRLTRSEVVFGLVYNATRALTIPFCAMLLVGIALFMISLHGVSLVEQTGPFESIGDDIYRIYAVPVCFVGAIFAVSGAVRHALGARLSYRAYLHPFQCIGWLGITLATMLSIRYCHLALYGDTSLTSIDPLAILLICLPVLILLLALAHEFHALHRLGGAGIFGKSDDGFVQQRYWFACESELRRLLSKGAAPVQQLRKALSNERKGDSLAVLAIFAVLIAFLFLHFVLRPASTHGFRGALAYPWMLMLPALAVSIRCASLSRTPIIHGQYTRTAYVYAAPYIRISIMITLTLAAIDIWNSEILLSILWDSPARVVQLLISDEPFRSLPTLLISFFGAQALTVFAAITSVSSKRPWYWTSFWISSVALVGLVTQMNQIPISGCLFIISPGPLLSGMLSILLAFVLWIISGGFGLFAQRLHDAARAKGAELNELVELDPGTIQPRNTVAPVAPFRL